MTKRRDITLGEMQDECKARNDNCDRGGDKCKFFEMCAIMQTIDKGCLTPIMWNLTDPPRFNEAQMELLKAYYTIGVRSLIETGGEEFISLRGENGRVMGTVYRNLLPEDVQKDIPLDLAELLGKDGA